MTHQKKTWFHKNHIVYVLHQCFLLVCVVLLVFLHRAAVLRRALIPVAGLVSVADLAAVAVVRVAEHVVLATLAGAVLLVGLCCERKGNKVLRL